MGTEIGNPKHERGKNCRGCGKVIPTTKSGQDSVPEAWGGGKLACHLIIFGGRRIILVLFIYVKIGQPYRGPVKDWVRG